MTSSVIQVAAIFDDSRVENVPGGRYPPKVKILPRSPTKHFRTKISPYSNFPTGFLVRS